MNVAKHVPHRIDQHLCHKVREFAHALNVCVDFKVVQTSVGQELEQMNLGNGRLIDGLKGELDVFPADFNGQSD